MHNSARVLVQKCMWFCRKRTQHRQVIDITILTTFCCPKLFVVVYKLVIFVLETLSEYISVPSFVTKGHSMGKLYT